jgi:predicted DNA-binding transcriptional regulator AlpA
MSTIPRKFLRISEVSELTTISKSHIYHLVRVGSMPAPIKLSVNTSVWDSQAIQDWIEDCIQKSMVSQ